MHTVIKATLLVCGVICAVTLGLTRPARAQRPPVSKERNAAALRDNNYLVIEQKLAPLGRNLHEPQPGEWLHEHQEPGQNFAEYLRARPMRRTSRLNHIYICLLGDFSDEQTKLLDRTRSYLEIFFATPVEIRNRVPLKEIPEGARRQHPTWGDSQVLSTWVLDELLKPNVPNDALAYLAFTSSDLWPGDGWNFVYGQANLRDRTGVWSVYRNGDPSKGKEESDLCLRRTLRTASHETCHILTMQHCIAFQCNLNGVNHQAEGDSKPLHLCPVCLRKLCWNLQVDPNTYLARLRRFCQDNGLDDEAKWYAEAIQVLKSGK